MISSVGKHFGTPIPYLETPTQGGIVDLMFGRPLIQTIDFELPFGSAVFRHVRTFGNNFAYHGGDRRNPFWDWNGKQWMMSENPIFLIDAQPRWGLNTEYIDMPQPRCYLIPDAHHAIPFLYDENVDRYVAPSWFDAITDYRTNGGDPPDEIHVWLNRQSIKYTFRAYREDYSTDGKDAHTPPPEGHGYPYYAMLTRLEDRHGNRIEYEYCDLLQFEAGCCTKEAPAYEGPCYTCNQQGQIKSIKLYPAQSGEGDPPVWTLLYYHQVVHVTYHNTTKCDPGTCHQTWKEHKLRSIFVYEGDVDLSFNACFTLPEEAFCNSNGPNGLEDWDNIEYPGAPDNWVLQAEYTYNPAEDLPAKLGINPNVVGECASSRSDVGLLLRAVVRRKDAGAEAGEAREERMTLYRYAASCEGSAIAFSPRIKSIFEPQTLDGIVTDTGGMSLGNYLMTLSDTGEIDVQDPQSGEVIQKQLRDIATHRFQYCTADWGGTDLFNYLANEYVQGPALTRVFGSSPAKRHIANTGNPQVDGTYQFYILFSLMNDDLAGDRAGYWEWDGHVPFYYKGHIPHYNYNGTVEPEPPLPFDMARHVTIIDRLKPGAVYDPDDHRVPYGEYGMLSRRVMEMNAAGFVLRERMFDFDDDCGGLMNQQGYAKQKIYDEHGRIRQIRTAGWGSIDNANTIDSDGLIYFFEYDDVDTNGIPDELSREGIMLGTNGTRYYLADYEHSHPERPELVSRTTRFRTPVTDPETEDPENHQVAYSHYDLGDDDEVLFEEHVSNTGRFTETEDPIYALRRVRYDDQGRPQHRGFGQATTLDDPATQDMLEFFYNYTEYDQYGRKTCEIIDADTHSIADEFERVVADEVLLPALEWETAYRYDMRNRPEQIDKPGGLSDRFAYDLTGPDGLLEMWKYADVKNGETAKPVQIVRYSKQGRMDSTLQVHLDTLNGLYNGSESYTEEDVVSTARMLYDEFGRPAGAQALADVNTNSSALTARISYDAFGQVGRQQSPDSTITRTVHGMRGRVSKVYKGTQDWHIYWGTAVWCDAQGEPEHCIDEDDPEQADDNMVLTEKWYYGDGTAENGGKNATGKVVAQRRYQRKPTNQYFLEDDEQPGLYPENDEDDIGLVTAYEYDCRMRPVCIEEQSELGELLFVAVAWYDYQNREVMAAEYSPDGLPADDQIDPRMFDIDTPAPSASMILSASPPPLSLKQTIHDKIGRVCEERTYDVSAPDGNVYVSVQYDYDSRGLVVDQQSPNSPRTKSVYDARGRLIRRQSFAGDAELHRAEKVYDEHDNLLEEITWERPYDALGDSLDECSPDPVRRYRHYWYDQSNRLIATADYGTNSSSGTFENGDAPQRPANPPSCGSADVLVTQYAYDDAGRQNEVIDSACVVTRTEYDDIGRVMLVTENAGGQPGEPRRHTAYQYDTATGLLVKVAAVRDEHFCDTPSYDAIDWEAGDGTLQVTRYAYGGPVLDATTNGTYSDASANGGWISAVHYPDPDTGQPQQTPAVTFGYRFDGQVARRVDARGVELLYRYDDRDRLESIEAVAVPPEVSDSNMAMRYEYEPNGMLKSASSMISLEGGERSRVEFEYGGFGQLTRATQIHGVNPPVVIGTVTYDWEADSAANGYRLSAITYPNDETVTFDYGPAGGIDDWLDRVTGVRLNGTLLAGYRYMGLGRKVGASLGNGISVDFDDGFGGPPTGLDQFGRILDLTYAGNSPEPLVQVGYGYDSRGNRTFARITGGAEGQSWRYWYDSLNRLIGAARGTLNAAGDSFIGDTDPETIGWSLDDLGNWSSDGVDKAGLRRFTDVGGDGIFDDATDTLHSWQRHNTNEVNEIESVTVGDAAGTNGVEAFAYDDAGNLILDHEHYYIYDAWNRLAEVCYRGTMHVGTNGLEGVTGRLMLFHEYDALGRRVCTIKYPTVAQYQKTIHLYGGSAACLAEYDDVFSHDPALQRWFVHGQSFPDPLVMVDESDAGDWPAGVAEVLYYLKDALGSVMALADEDGEVVERYFYDPYGKVSIVGADQSPVMQLPATPPGDYFDANFNGLIEVSDFDHFETCMVDRPTNLFCVFVHDVDGDGSVTLHDESIFVYWYSEVVECWVEPETCEGDGIELPVLDCARAVGLSCDLDQDGDLDLFDVFGFQACINSNGPMCRFVYDVDRDGDVDLSDYAVFEEFLLGPTDWPPTTTPRPSRYGNPFMWTGQRYDPVTGQTLFLARTYSPELGRFLQRDPLGPLDSTGEPYFGEPGSAPSIGSPLVAAVSEYLSAFNLYLYVNASPINGTDPFGLSSDFDYFDEADDIIADIYADRVAAAHHAFQQIGQIAQATAQAALFAAITAMCPPAGLAMSAWGLAVSLEDMYYNGLTWGNAAGATLSAVGVRASLGPSVAFVGKLRGGLARTQRAYRAMRGGSAHAAKLVGHHTIPRAVLKQLPKRVRSRIYGQSRGGNRIIWDIPSDIHDTLHGAVGRGYGKPGGAWNTRWHWEIRAKGGYKNVAADDIYEIRDRLVRDFDLERFRPG
ncbi:MAG: hypothetical protein KAV82_10250 [Phycisphaerae bacterium]|nr:hypothetical protein [Phycisphaerae bacterium]